MRKRIKIWTARPASAIVGLLGCADARGVGYSNEVLQSRNGKPQMAFPQRRIGFTEL